MNGWNGLLIIESITFQLRELISRAVSRGHVLAKDKIKPSRFYATDFLICQCW